MTMSKKQKQIGPDATFIRYAMMMRNDYAAIYAERRTPEPRAVASEVVTRAALKYRVWQ